MAQQPTSLFLTDSAPSIGVQGVAFVLAAEIPGTRCVSGMDHSNEDQGSQPKSPLSKFQKVFKREHDVVDKQGNFVEIK